MSYFVDPNLRVFEMLMASEGIRVLARVVAFETFTPRLLLISAEEEKKGKQPDDQRRVDIAQLGLKRIKKYLGRRDYELGDRLIKCLVAIGGAGGPPRRAGPNTKKDDMSSMDLRRVTRGLLEWMDELVKREVGLYEDEESGAAYAGGSNLGVSDDDRESVLSSDEDQWLAGEWFQDDLNVKQYLIRLVPVLTSTSAGSIVHEPLVSLVAHLKMLNQRTFDTVVFTFDEEVVEGVAQHLGLTLVRPGNTPVKGKKSSSMNVDINVEDERVREEIVQKPQLEEARIGAAKNDMVMGEETQLEVSVVI